MRSAPTTIAPILPWRIMAPAMLSEITVVGMLSLFQFPSREAGALQERPGFIRIDVDFFALLDCRADHS